MGKSTANAVLDAALSYVSTNADRICVCSTEPTTYTEAITTYKLAISTTPSFQSPADRGGGGREMEVDAEVDMNVDASGDAEHIALCYSGGSSLLIVTTCTLQNLTSGNDVSTPAWKIGIGDPT